MDNTDDVNPLQTMISTMAQHGASLELKKKMPDGSYQTASEGTLRAIGAQARIATTAQGLEAMTKKERNEWAIHMKDRGNEYYANREFDKAINTYVEALTATDFGKSENVDDQSDENRGNIDDVVVPMICNLAACCIQMKDWGKVIKFCEQCLALRPKCARAIARRGIALLHIGEYDRSLKDLIEGEKLTEDPAEKGRIKILISKAEKCVEEQEKALARRRKAMQSAFKEGTGDERVTAAASSKKKKSAVSSTDFSHVQKSNLRMTIAQYFIAFAVMIVACGLFYVLLEFVD